MSKSIKNVKNNVNVKIPTSLILIMFVFLTILFVVNCVLFYLAFKAQEKCGKLKKFSKIYILFIASIVFYILSIFTKIQGIGLISLIINISLIFISKKYC